MHEVVAKKYVGALLSSLDASEIAQIDSALSDIKSAFASSKFVDIINLPSLSAEKKAEFLLSLVECNSAKFSNFLLTLAKAKRLEALPDISREFSYQKALRDNKFKGAIFSSFELNEASKKELEDKFSKKLNANIEFESKKVNYDGIKIELSDLGFEASFSMNLFKEKLTEHILKAIK